MPPSSVRRFLAVAFSIGLTASAMAGEYLVTPTATEEMKAVFGQVESRDLVPARARIAGVVRDIAVEVGSQVTAGDVVAVVVDDKLALERDAAEAEIRALSSQLANARVELDRSQQLLARQTISKSQIDAVQTQVDVFVNQLAAATARLAVVDQQSAEGKVTAPLSGRVLSVPVAKGSVVLAGETLVRVAGGGYFLRLSLPERHAADIRTGGSVRVGRRGLSQSTPAGGEQMQQGTVARVYPEISEGRVLADVEVTGLGSHFVGERILVWLPVGSRTVLAVPVAGVATRHGMDFVTLAATNGRTEIAVVLGERLPGDRVEILTGLRAGDRVVLP